MPLDVIDAHVIVAKLATMKAHNYQYNINNELMNNKYILAAINAV